MKIFKTFLWIILVAVLSGCLNDEPDKYPSIKELNEQFCAKDGRRYEHTVVILDLTSELKQAQVDYIKEMVFSEGFFKSYQPFTKFSYVLINEKTSQSQQPLFSKCRPKAGVKTEFDSFDLPTKKESELYVKRKWKRFIVESEKIFQSVFEKPLKSNYSLIYETVVSTFKIPKFDFGNNYRKRNLIIVSDMMQHSNRISFYNFCRTKNSKKPNLCPAFDRLMSNSSTRDYINSTSPSNEDVDIKIIFLNNRYETSRSLDSTLIRLWIEYFERAGFRTPQIEYQLDVN